MGLVHAGVVALIVIVIIVGFVVVFVGFLVVINGFVVFGFVDVGFMLVRLDPDCVVVCSVRWG